MGGTFPHPLHTQAHHLLMQECSLETITLMGKVFKLRFQPRLRALPFCYLAEGYRLLFFRPQFRLGRPELLILHLPLKTLWLMDGTHFRVIYPLRNRWQGETPPLLMGIRGQVPLIPRLALLVPQFDLNLLDLSKLMNEPVRHDPSWPPVPTKLPSDIPKFEGKVGEDPGAHATTFHLWCSLNSLNEDSVRLRLFQRTLTSTKTKCYIELPSVVFSSFWDLASAFLSHFQLLV